MKICKKCNIEKDENEFYKHHLGGLRHSCKSCHKLMTGKWKKEYQTDKHKLQQRQYSNKVYLQRKAEIDKIKLGQGCVDCGYNSHAEALQFDHTDRKQKQFKISGSHMRNWKKLIDEIAKCVVRCANCHAVKTKKEKDNYALISYLD